MLGIFATAHAAVSNFSSRAATITQQLQASIAGTSAVPYFSARASSVKQHFQRLLSFESTAAAAEEQQPLPPTPAGVATGVTPSPLQVQSGGRPSDTDTASQEGDSKRVGKSVQVVGLFLATASFGLMVTQPAREERSYLLFEVYTTFVYLTLCLGIGLSIHSIVARKGPKSVWLQKRLMVIGLGFMAAVFVLRTCIVLPMNSLTFVWILFLLIGLVIFFYLRLAWNKDDDDTPAVEDHPSDIV